MALRPVAGLRIAGRRVRFESDRDGIISVLKRRYAPFAAGGGGGVSFEASAVPGKPAPYRPAVKEEAGRVELGRGDFRAWLGPGGKGRLEAAPNEQCLDAFLRTYLSFDLLRRGGLMLHAAGLRKGGRAWLFPGISGAGKSTLSRLAGRAGLEVISDEISLALPSGRGWRLYGSPFWGEMRAAGRPGSWPLAGVLFPVKAKRHGLADCGRGEALRRLLRCTVNFERSEKAGSAALAAAAGLLAAVPARKLEFSRGDGRFTELLNEV